MSQYELDEETLSISVSVRDDSLSGADARLCLLIIYHPDTARIGERFWLEGVFGKRRGYELSRSTPEFTDGRGRATGPLGVRTISRRPILMVGTSNHGLAFEFDKHRVTLSVDGKSLRSGDTIPPEKLDEGCALCLNNIVIFWLGRNVPEHVSDDDMGLLGLSEQMETIRQQIRAVGERDVAVLLRGESGTGKELAAQALHQHSQRKSRKMLSVNMSAVSPELIASELFGHEAGAFTGAGRAKPGWFRAADGGTLFLDEIGHAHMPTQLALLRTLETGQVLPVGSTRPVNTDVRIIAATDLDLDAAVEEGRFHSALIERLGVVELHLPPLRDRREDIPLLLLSFLRHFLEEDQAARLLDDPDNPWLPGDVMEAFLIYDWPRNVRQLRNVAREFALLCASRPFQPGPKTQAILDDIEDDLDDEPTASATTSSSSHASDDGQSAQDLDRESIVEALRANKYAVKRTARALNISHQSLYRLMERYDFPKAKEFSREDFLKHLEEAGGDIEVMSHNLLCSTRALRMRRRELGL